MSDPKEDAEVHFMIALEMTAEGKTQEAIDEYELALAADPHYHDALHGLARAYQDAGRLDDAIAISQKLVDLDPDDVLPHTSLSILYQKKGMIPEAEAEANRARVLGWKQQLKERSGR
jgi:tetratricopeptide (TPR) repeat protein